MMAADPSGIVVHGHRGARMRLPENTLPAFEYAIREGAHAIELDLQVSKDNALIVSTTITAPDRVVTPIEEIVGEDVSVQRLDVVAREGLDIRATQTQVGSGTRLNTTYPSYPNVVQRVKTRPLSNNQNHTSEAAL